MNNITSTESVFRWHSSYRWNRDPVYKMKRWCEQNCKDLWTHSPIHFSFTDQGDWLAFELVWKNL